MSIVNWNILEDFGRDWCWMCKVRIDWKWIWELCEGNMIYEDNLLGWNIENRINLIESFVKLMDIWFVG